MARIAANPIELPQGVKIRMEGKKVFVEGPKGKLSLELMSGLKLDVKEKSFQVLLDPSPMESAKSLSARHGLSRTLLKNMIQGVAAGFEKKLEIRGVGYRATVEKGKLNMTLGFTNPVVVELPQGITVDVEKQTMLTVKGVDKYQVGETAAKIRRVKPPEVYKGTGIRYLGEHVIQKVGKAAAGAKAGGK